MSRMYYFQTSFNTQPPEGGWQCRPLWQTDSRIVSTHSRLKAAGIKKTNGNLIVKVSTHSRLKAAGYAVKNPARRDVSFNTQPPEGGWAGGFVGHDRIVCVSTHSRLKAAGTCS